MKLTKNYIYNKDGRRMVLLEIQRNNIHKNTGRPCALTPKYDFPSLKKNKKKKTADSTKHLPLYLG